MERTYFFCWRTGLYKATEIQMARTKKIKNRNSIQLLFSISTGRYILQTENVFDLLTLQTIVKGRIVFSLDRCTQFVSLLTLGMNIFMLENEYCLRREFNYLIFTKGIIGNKLSMINLGIVFLHLDFKIRRI